MTRYTAPEELRVFGVAGIPEIRPGDDLAAIILKALREANKSLQSGDVVVAAQKIISKSEGRLITLSSVSPSSEAIDLGKKTEKDPRLVELILRESVSVVAHRPGVLIVEHKSGLVLANAGIDRSNVENGHGDETVLLLPENPDRSAAALRDGLGVNVGVVINDSLGRAWRVGTIGTAIGVAGLSAIVDLNGNPDMQQRPLQATIIGMADELAAAASIVMGQAAEARPVAIIRGLSGHLADGAARDLMRPRETDLFR